MRAIHDQDPLAAVSSTERLAALDRTGLLDSAPDNAFDRLTRLASRMLKAPISLVSLVDDRRQFFKSSVGLPEPWSSLRETPLSHSFCQYVVAAARPLVVDDARSEPRFRDNLAIRDLGVVAYAGVPLRTSEGEVIGALCAIDSKARTWTTDELATLEDLSASVAAEIDLALLGRSMRSLAAEIEGQRQVSQALLDSAGEGIYSVDAQGTCLFINRAGAELIGREPHQVIGQNIHQLTHHSHPDGTPYPIDACPLIQSVRTGTPIRHQEEIMWRADGSTFLAEYSAFPRLGDNSGESSDWPTDPWSRRRRRAAAPPSWPSSRSPRNRVWCVLTIAMSLPGRRRRWSRRENA